jgi:hypothetical protein
MILWVLTKEKILIDLAGARIDGTDAENWGE